MSERERRGATPIARIIAKNALDRSFTLDRRPLRFRRGRK